MELEIDTTLGKQIEKKIETKDKELVTRKARQFLRDLCY
jgi:hypothetical protein